MSANKLHFSLAIDPDELPTAQQKGEKPMINRKTGKAWTLHFVKPKVEKAHNLIRDALTEALKGEVFDRPRNKPWFVMLIYVYKLPRNYPKKLRGTYKVTQPDSDNIVKLFLDAATETKLLWKNDAQVQLRGVYKRYHVKGESPRILVTITVPSEDEDGVMAHDC